MNETSSPQALAWLYALLGWVGGVATTVGGSVVASRIRVYDDNRKAHRDELKAGVLEPLRDGVKDHLHLFAHRVAVILEAWGYRRAVRASRSDHRVRITKRQSSSNGTRTSSRAAPLNCAAGWSSRWQVASFGNGVTWWRSSEKKSPGPGIRGEGAL